MIRAADLANFDIVCSEVRRVLQDDGICEQPFEQSVYLLQEMIEDAEHDISGEPVVDQEVEGMINYLTMTVKAYLQRRKNIFEILKQDLANN